MYRIRNINWLHRHATRNTNGKLVCRRTGEEIRMETSLTTFVDADVVIPNKPIAYYVCPSCGTEEGRSNMTFGYELVILDDPSIHAGVV